MVNFRVRVIKQFQDAITKEMHEIDELLDLTDANRVKNMVRLKVADLLYARHTEKKKGKKIIVHQNFVYTIGGIETANYNMAKTFKDRDITFLFNTADIEQALRLAQYCNVEMIYRDTTYECDVLILSNYDSYPLVKGRVKAKKIYQQCHADWLNMKRMPQWRTFDWQPDTDVDKVLAVSETTQYALEHAFDKPIKSTIVPNILAPIDKSEYLTFLTLSRMSAEKGGDLVLKMVQMLDEANKEFIWFMASDIKEYSSIKRSLSKYPQVIFIQPSTKNTGLLQKVDYCVQLSHNESYCYTVHEALSVGTPVIGTNIPEFQKIIKNGVNGYLVDNDLNTLDIDTIYNKIPKFKPTPEQVDPVWEKVLNGEL